MRYFIFILKFSQQDSISSHYMKLREVQDRSHGLKVAASTLPSPGQLVPKHTCIRQGVLAPHNHSVMLVKLFRICHPPPHNWTQPSRSKAEASWSWRALEGLWGIRKCAVLPRGSKSSKRHPLTLQEIRLRFQPGENLIS